MNSHVVVVCVEEESQIRVNRIILLSPPPQSFVYHHHPLLECQSLLSGLASQRTNELVEATAADLMVDKIKRKKGQ